MLLRIPSSLLGACVVPVGWVGRAVRPSTSFLKQAAFMANLLLRSPSLPSVLSLNLTVDLSTQF